MKRVEMATGEFYHVYNRGTERRAVFMSERDYDRFLSLMYICNSLIPVDLKLQGSTLDLICSIERGETLVDLCAFCLMPNHFHLVLREKDGDGISRFMQKLTTGYTMYFNRLNGRTGALFQGRYKAQHADKDEYLSYLLAYVHLNPVKLIEPQWKESGIADPERVQRYMDTYQYSSYLDYCGKQRTENKIIDQTALPVYFEKPADFQSTMHSYLQQLQG